MDIYENNIRTIIKNVKKGSKICNSKAVGVELEHFVINKNTGECVPYIGGVEQVIEQLAPHFKEHFYSEGSLIGLANENYNITLEPGAQIEISIKPTEHICEISHIYDEFLSIINPILDKYSYELATYGYLPKNKVEDIDLIPKKRYEFMDEYFKTAGTRGINMMRGTASTQVSIDFTDERDCVKKLRLANILSPLFALICDNSPIFEGKPFCGNTLRTYIWNNVDNDRCGVIPSSCDDDFSFRKYAEYIYNSSAILIQNGDDATFTGSMKIYDIYKDTLITDEDAEHLLSMFFPDVRLKQYIEIRPADSIPIEYVLSYATLIKGIFQNELPFDGISADDIANAKEQIILHGFNADIYGTKAYILAEKIYEMAYNSLDENDRNYLLPLKNIIFNRKTLKEMDNIAEGRKILQRTCR